MGVYKGYKDGFILKKTIYSIKEDPVEKIKRISYYFRPGSILISPLVY